jgi:hypothetical protein
VLDLIHTVMHGVRSLQYQWPDEPTLAGLTPMEGKVLGFFARHPGPPSATWPSTAAGTRPSWRG